MANWFSEIGGWFHHQETAIQQIFKRVEPLVGKAEPIVAEIATVAGAFPKGTPAGGILAGIAKYLAKATPDTAAIASFVKANESAPLPNILHNAGVLALSLDPSIKTSNPVLKDLDLAVQLAYNTLAQKNPTVSQNSTVAAITTPAAPAAGAAAKG